MFARWRSDYHTLVLEYLLRLKRVSSCLVVQAALNTIVGGILASF